MRKEKRRKGKRHGNTKGVIAVATLLVAVVGATFAYFTATGAGDTNEEEAVNVETATVSNVTLTMTPEEATSFNPVYPGTWLATGVEIAAAYESSAPTTDYKVTYTLEGEIDLSAFKTSASTSEFTYSIYRVDDQKVDNPVTSCQDHETNDGGTFKMYVDNCAVDGKLTSGTLLEENASIDYTNDDDGKIQFSKTLQSLDVGSSTHYYLVVKYENKAEDNQAETDAGKEIKMKFTAASNPTIDKKATD